MLSLGEGSSISFLVGDITLQKTDAIVNAANSSLMGGGGVDGAIHRAGGPAILEACKKIVSECGTLPAGQAVWTTGGNLPAAYVIHTVGPKWRGGAEREPETLASCYRESLLLADRLQITNIAFPSISTGVYGYPVEQAARIAVKTVVENLKNCRCIRDARFVLFDQRTFAAYKNAAREFVRNAPEGHRYSIT